MQEQSEYALSKKKVANKIITICVLPHFTAIISINRNLYNQGQVHCLFPHFFFSSCSQDDPLFALLPVSQIFASATKNLGYSSVAPSIR